MIKADRTGGYCAFQRLMAFLMAWVLLLGCAGTAFADDPPEPAPALDQYVIDGITYFNVDSPNFERPAHYLRDLMGTESGEELDGRSMAERWLEVGLGGLLYSNSAYKTFSGYESNAFHAFPIEMNTCAETLFSAINADTRQASLSLVRELPGRVHRGDICHKPEASS